MFVIQSVPLALTILRIMLAFLLPVGIKLNSVLFFNILIVLAGLTDFLDGFLARKFNAITKLGSQLDPAADKIFLLTLTACFYALNVINQTIFLLLLFKEVIIVTGFLVKSMHKKIISAIFISKFATAMQFFAYVMLLNQWKFGMETLIGSIILGYLSIAAYLCMHYNRA